jgi:hypothetical protein
MNSWRMQAKYKTECSRCLDWILPGQWIAEDAEFGGEWTHCVCPRDVQKLAAQPKELTTYSEFVRDEDGNMVEIVKTLE